MRSIDDAHDAPPGMWVAVASPARPVHVRGPAGEPPGRGRDAGGGQVGRGRLDDRTHRRGHGPRAHGQPRRRPSCRPRRTRRRAARSCARLVARAAGGGRRRGGPRRARRRVADPSGGAADGRRPEPPAAVRRRREPRAAHPAHPAVDAGAAAGPAHDRRLGHRVRPTACSTTSTVCSPTRRRSRPSWTTCCWPPTRGRSTRSRSTRPRWCRTSSTRPGPRPRRRSIALDAQRRRAGVASSRRRSRCAGR